MMTRGVSQKYPLSKQLRFTEVVMDEGDVLIFPMFTPHQTRTLTGETPLPGCAQTSPQELCWSWEIYGRRKLSSVMLLFLLVGSARQAQYILLVLSLPELGVYRNFNSGHTLCTDTVCCCTCRQCQHVIPVQRSSPVVM